MNFYKHHLGDYAAATSHLSWDEDCAYRRLIDQYYKREAPLPADVKEAARLARAATPGQRRAVEAVLLEFFELRDGGWHQKRCDEEIGAASAQAETNRRIAAEREAKKRAEAERRAAAERARLEHESLNGTGHEQSTNRAPADSTVRAESVNLAISQTPDSISQTPAPNPPTAAGALGLAVKRAGIPPASFSGADTMTLQALAEQGATPQEVEDTAREALAKGVRKPVAWIAATIAGRRDDAARLRLAPPAAAPAEPKPDTRAQAWLAEQTERAREVDQQRAARLAARKGAAS